MIPINTDVDVANYFFKLFAWKDDGTSMGLVLTNNTANFYASNNMKDKPQLTDSFPMSSKQSKILKKYLFSYEDYCRNTVQYFNCDINNNVMYLNGYFKNKYVKKCIVGDSADSKIFNSIIKVLSNQPLTEEDYIEHFVAYRKAIKH